MRWNLKTLEQYLLIGSTLVEGSTLTEAEGKTVLKGKTVQGHSIAEIRELLNHRSCIEWFISEVSKSPFVSKQLIQHFHSKLFQGFSGEHGRWKAYQNYAFTSDGTRHDYLHPAKVESATQEWLKKFNATKSTKTKSESATIAADLYYDFQEIHPFDDGNGRIGRFLISYWLHWKAYSFFTFYLKDKTEHLMALEMANRGNKGLLIKFFMKRISKESSK